MRHSRHSFNGTQHSTQHDEELKQIPGLETPCTVVTEIIGGADALESQVEIKGTSKKLRAWFKGGRDRSGSIEGDDVPINNGSKPRINSLTPPAAGITVSYDIQRTVEER